MSRPLWKEQMLPLTLLVAALDQLDKDVEATEPKWELTPYLGDIPVHLPDEGVIGYLKNEDSVGWAFYPGDLR